MKITSRKKNILVFCLCLMLCLCSTCLYATNTQSETQSFEKEISTLVNLQKQIWSLGESGFNNFALNQPNDTLLKSLPIYKTQVDAVRSDLLNYKANPDFNKLTQSKVGTLLSATSVLNYLIDTLNDYLTTKELKDQFDYLTIFIQTDTFLTQIFGLVNASSY